MRTQWTDRILADQLQEICGGIGRFPSAADLRGMGRGDIASQLSRRGGFRAWAKRLGVPHASSDSDFGWEGEAHCADLLRSKGFRVEARTSIKCPYDLIIDGVVRVDVKTARRASYGAGSGWYYRIGKHVQCDVVALYRHDRSDAFLMPWWECGTTNITVTDCGAHARYHNAFDTLRDLVVTRKTERTELTF